MLLNFIDSFVFISSWTLSFAVDLGLTHFYTDLYEKKVRHNSLSITCTAEATAEAASGRTACWAPD